MKVQSPTAALCDKVLGAFGESEVQCHLRRPANRAFTLIELLVVLAVILILMTLLLPVLVNSRAKGLRTQCLNNIKQVDLTFLMYGHENRDRLPAGYFITYLPAPIADSAARDGTSSRVFYDPGLVAAAKASMFPRDVTEAWFRPSAWGPGRDIAYCLTLPGTQNLFGTNVNATIIPQPISLGANVLLPPPNASQRVLVAGSAIADVKTGAISVSPHAFGLAYAEGGGVWCGHPDPKAARPLGDNVAMLDGSAKWRNFKDMTCRLNNPGAASPGTIWAYW